MKKFIHCIVIPSVIIGISLWVHQYNEVASGGLIVCSLWYSVEHDK
jgi:hypothetical protein